MKNKGLVALLGTSILASAFSAKADRLKILPSSELGFHLNNMIVEHKTGSTEGFGANDSALLATPSPAMDMYSTVDGNNLEWDSRPYSSLSDVVVKIVGRGISSGSKIVTNKPSFTINDSAFANVNIYSDLYSITNGVRANLIRTDDLKAMASASESIPITVTNGYNYDFVVRFAIPNTPPVASNSSFNVAKHETLTNYFNVSDSDGTIASVNVINGDGNLSFNNVTNFSYNANGYVGNKTYDFYATDNNGANSSTNALSINSTNTPPISSSVSINGVRTSLPIDFVLPASDADNDPLTGIVLNQGLHGNTSLVGTNGTYTPTSDIPLNDTISYYVSDGFGGFATNNVSVNLTNVPPVSYNSTIKGNKKDLINGSFPITTYPGNYITNVEVLNINEKLNVTGNATNFTFNPNMQVGTNTYDFVGRDNYGDRTSTNTLSVISTNRAPTLEDFALYGNKVGIMAGSVDAQDLDGDVLSVNILSGDLSKLLFTGTNFVYTPNGFTGTNSYSVVGNDGTDNSLPATLDFISTNRVPVALPLSFVAIGNGTSAVNTNALSYDADGDALTYSFNPASKGSFVQDGSTSNFVYTVSNNKYGSDLIPYRVNDGSENSLDSVVSVNVTAVNREPKFTSISRDNVLNNTQLEVMLQPNRTHDILRNYDLSDTNAWQVIGSTSIPYSTNDYASSLIIDAGETNTSAFYNLRSVSP